ncbi:MAG: hypothetical protein ABI861_09110, partial [Panacibacter sp.]
MNAYTNCHILSTATFTFPFLILAAWCFDEKMMNHQANMLYLPVLKVAFVNKELIINAAPTGVEIALLENKK